MPNYRRRLEPGATYFFTAVIHGRRPLLSEPGARRCLYQAFVETRRRWTFGMFACVLLPDHLHCIWTLPAGDDNYARRWSHLKRRFSQRYLASGGGETAVSASRSARRERGIWQPRFWEHLIRDEQELYAYRDYIHLNPVRHGYVRTPTDWKWSSVHRHLRLGWLEPDWTGWTPIEVTFVGE